MVIFFNVAGLELALLGNDLNVLLFMPLVLSSYVKINTLVTRGLLEAWDQVSVWACEKKLKLFFT